MKKQTIETFEKIAEQNNKKFGAASKKQKRVMILEDVLTLIGKSNVIINPGIYGSFTQKFDDQKFFDTDAQIKLLSSQTECLVCARGAMFCSRVRLGNQWKWLDDRIHDNDTTDALQDIFSKYELECIEAFFERKCDYFSNEYYEELTKEVKKIYPELFETIDPDFSINVVKNIIYFASVEFYPAESGRRLRKIVKNILSHPTTSIIPALLPASKNVALKKYLERQGVILSNNKK